MMFVYPSLTIPTVQPLEQLYPLTFLLCSDSTSSLSPLHSLDLSGQSTPLRFTSESVWPRPGVQPCTEPIGIQNHISSVGARHTSKLAPCISGCSEGRDSARLLTVSVFCIRKPNLCFMDSLSTLSLWLSLFLYLYWSTALTQFLSLSFTYSIPPSSTSLLGKC